MNGNDAAGRLMDFPAEWARQELFAAADGRLTYAEAREGMLAYAGCLSDSLGCRPGERIAICLPKSLETLLAILGLLAIGAVYVPLQYLGPPARLAAILASLRPTLLITTAEKATRIRAADGGATAAIRTIEIANEDDGLAALKRGIPAARTIAEVSPEDLAVIYFTSGSTGEPKGVMWSQRGMTASIAALNQWRRMTGADRLISISGLHYSASCEVFYPLPTGASIYLGGDHETMFGDRLAAVLERERTTIWSAAATGLRMLVESGNLPQRDLRALRRVEIFGERMSIPALRAAMDALPHAEFHNLYAASEAFDMIEYPIPRPLGADVTTLPLGRPSPVYRLSLRDENGLEVAPGEPGEICAIGPPVTMGYWNDPALSAAKRLKGVPDSYRTGDLAIQGDDGLIHLIGRRDQMVKLRGQRLDLGEIEAVAKSEPRVREAVAVSLPAPNDGNEVVLAVLAREDSAGLESELHRICRDRLPSFARPGRIAIFDEFPQLSSGKIDRRALEQRLARI